jgi:hypothetical protein
MLENIKRREIFWEIGVGNAILNMSTIFGEEQKLSSSSLYEAYWILECIVLYSGRNSPKIWRKVLSPFLTSKNRLLILQSWRWNRYVPVIYRWASVGPHIITSQTLVFHAVTTVATTNSLYNFLQPSIISSIIGPNILLSNQCQVSLRAKD